VKRSLRSWLWRIPLDREFDEEVELHIEMRTRELIDQGIDPAEARAMAIRKMGDLEAFKRTCVDLGRKRDREMSITLWLEELREDIKFAFRQLLAAPAFTLVAVLTLALGIGANSAIFALVDATLLRPLGYNDAERLVTIWETTSTTPRGFASPPNMLDWKSRSRTFETVAGYTPSMGSMVMAGRDGNALTVSRQWVTSGIFDVLGVRPIAGRTFGAEDEAQRRRSVVISEGLWETRFNRDASIVGSELRLDGELWTVVGVMPKTFDILGRTAMWAMRPFPPNLPPRARAAYQLQVVGRLKPGVAVEAAQADLTAVAEGLSREFPEYNKGRSVTVEPLHDTMVGSDLKSTSMLFLGVVGFVLLICCANVANLLLARATARARELAVRSALGAGRRRIIRQLLTESVVLSIIGGLLGIAVGAAILQVAPVLIPDGLLPPAVSLGFDMRVVAFCAFAALLVGVVFGIAPAFQATSVAPVEAMGADSRTTTGSGGRLRSLLVAGEVATAVLLLFGAGLLLRTLMAVQSYDRGYRAESVLSMLVDPLGSSYPTPESLQQFLDQVEAEVRAVPGVADVGWSSSLPLGENIFGGEYPWHYEVVGDPPQDPSRKPITSYQIVSSTYFSTLELPIVAGRNFDAREARGNPNSIIVNEAFARTLGGRNPIGLRISFKPVDSAPTTAPSVAEIVGVAKQVKQRPDEATDYVQIYTALPQDLIGDVMLLVKSKTGRAEALTSGVRAAITKIDKDQLVSVSSITTLEDVEWTATGRHRFRAVMVASFAALAVMLAMVGVFGILAYSVQQRVRDFGVRRALGATSNDVVRLVVSDAARVILMGVAVGLVLSAVLGRMITSLLFGVQPMDLATFAFVIGVLAITAAMSVAGPAWRASRIDPAVALRSGK
jgi:putative ABC transport system permease protein